MTACLANLIKRIRNKKIPTLLIEYLAMLKCQTIIISLIQRVYDHIMMKFPAFITTISRSLRPVPFGCRLSGTAAKRDSLEFDVVVVGGGPAGLSTAVRLKQRRPELSVCLIEKGSEIGAHTLSGNVFDPRALDELIPDWRSRPHLPLETPVSKDQFWYIPSSTTKLSIPILPPALHNHGNFVISLGRFVRWLADYAIEIGVEVYPGFAANEVLYNKSGAIIGISTKDCGIGRNGQKKSSFQPGMDLLSSQTVFAEGACGSLTEQVLDKYNLRSSSDPQTYSIGLKELWSVKSDHHKPGLVTHTVGWPLPHEIYGGSFIYHMKPNLLSIGFVVGLDYQNPYTNPYELFQRFKHHPEVAKLLEGGTPLEYGARVISTGGYQSIPKLSVPGGLIVGCAAGFLNVPRIKGTHTAMKSGMLAADSIVDKLESNDSIAHVDLNNYESLVKSSWIWSELKQVRNVKPSFKLLGGLFGGLIYSGIDLMLLKGRVPWTIHNKITDSDATQSADQFSPEREPFKPDNKISFDLLTNVQRSGVRHEEDQPIHLRLREGISDDLPVTMSLKKYAGPEQFFCPAKVYEYVSDADGRQKLQINAANCVHCKTCDIKTPKRFIRWTVPEGGGGPAYSNM